MVKLVLYSDQISPATDAIDERLARMLPQREAVIGYLPSTPDPERIFYNERVAYYERLNLKLKYFDPEMDFVEDDLKMLRQCDAIHLSGGNTYDFMHWLSQKGLISELQTYVRKGGVLIGVSAGA